jgi:hypothetical protein
MSQWPSHAFKTYANAFLVAVYASVFVAIVCWDLMNAGHQISLWRLIAAGPGALLCLLAIIGALIPRSAWSRVGLWLMAGIGSAVAIAVGYLAASCDARIGIGAALFYPAIIFFGLVFVVQKFTWAMLTLVATVGLGLGLRYAAKRYRSSEIARSLGFTIMAQPVIAILSYLIFRAFGVTNVLGGCVL